MIEPNGEKEDMQIIYTKQSWIQVKHEHTVHFHPDGAKFVKNMWQHLMVSIRSTN